MERWKEIADFEWAEISSYGRVRVKPRVIEYHNARGTLVRKHLQGGLRKIGVCTNDYLGLMIEGKNLLVHRLVAQAFVDGDTSLDVNHKNGVKSDNVWTNLEWSTRAANIQHSYDHLARKPHGLITTVLVDGVPHRSMLDAARALGVSVGSVSSAINKNHLCRGKVITRVLPR